MLGSLSSSFTSSEMNILVRKGNLDKVVENIFSREDLAERRLLMDKVFTILKRDPQISHARVLRENDANPKKFTRLVIMLYPGYNENIAKIDLKKYLNNSNPIITIEYGEFVAL
jgi:hypothetical protein